MKKFLVLAVVAASTMACLPSNQRVHNTQFGEVTCEHYTLTNTSLDKALIRPESLDQSSANAICKQEGKRIKAELQAQKS